MADEHAQAGDEAGTGAPPPPAVTPDEGLAPTQPVEQGSSGWWPSPWNAPAPSGPPTAPMSTSLPPTTPLFPIPSAMPDPAAPGAAQGAPWGAGAQAPGYPPQPSYPGGYAPPPGGYPPQPPYPDGYPPAPGYGPGQGQGPNSGVAGLLSPPGDTSGYPPAGWGPPGPPGGPYLGAPQSSPPMGLFIALAAVLVLLLAGALVVWRPWSQGSDRATTAVRPPSAVPTAPAGADPRGSQGSSGGQSVGPTAPPQGGGDAKAWIAGINTYCRVTVDPALKAAKALNKSDYPRSLELFAAANRDLDTLMRRDPPDSVKQQVMQIADNWDALADYYEQAAAALHKGDKARALALIEKGNAVNTLGNDLAIQIGLPDCANAGSLGSATQQEPSAQASV